jgi:outer membrane protein assembly factor BamB
MPRAFQEHHRRPSMPTSLFLVLVLLIARSALGAADWSQWRGPLATGATDEVGLPERCDDGTRCWNLALPGIGAGTPAVWGGQVFVTAIDRETSLFVVLAIDRMSGAVSWKAEVAIAFHPQHRDDLAAASPVCDAENVYVAFGSGDLAAYSHAGELRWKRNLQKDHGRFTNQWVHGSTPLLHGGLLVVQVLQTNPDSLAPTPRTTSYVLGIDPATGKDRWKRARPVTARGESQDAYTSPVPYDHDGKPGFIVLGGDALTGHDLADGRELWRHTGWNERGAKDWRMITTPVVAGRHIVLCTARGKRLRAVVPQDDGTMSVAWEHELLSSDVATPLLYRERLYVLNGDERELACFDPTSGELQWRGEFESTGVIRASPTAGDGRIYAVSEAGEVLVFASDAFRLISRSDLGSDGPTRASIALAHRMAFIRTADRLHAFATP